MYADGEAFRAFKDVVIYDWYAKVGGGGSGRDGDLLGNRRGVVCCAFGAAIANDDGDGGVYGAWVA